MQHYTFDNSHLPIIVRVPIHIIITLSLSVIALKVVLTALDFFQIGLVWLQSNSDLGLMIAVLVLIISLLVFDSLLMPLTDTGGFLISLYTSIKEEYDVQVYIRREYTSTMDELDYIRENFAKNFDLKSFCEFTEADKALEGILLSSQMDVIPDQVENMRVEMLNLEIPETVNAESLMEINTEFPGTVNIEPLKEAKIDPLEMEVKVPVVTNVEPLEEVKIEPEVDLGVIENFDDILEGVNIVNEPPIDLKTFGDFGKPLENIVVAVNPNEKPLEDLDVVMSPNDIAERLRLITAANKELIDAKNEVEKDSAKFPSKVSDSSPGHEDTFYSDLRKLKEKQNNL